MTNLMKIREVKTMTSREIADLVEARHNDLVSTIERLFSKDLLRSSRKTRKESTKGRPLDVYDLNFRDTQLVIAGYSDEHRAKVIDRWLELEVKEAQPSFTIPQTYAQALTLAAAQAVEIEEKDKQLATAAPKVDFVDQYVDTTGKTTFRQLAKILQVNERRLRHFLKDNKIMYQLNDEWVGYSKYMKNGMLETVTGFNKDMCRSFTTTVFTPKGVNYVASYWKK